MIEVLFEATKDSTQTHLYEDTCTWSSEARGLVVRNAEKGMIAWYDIERVICIRSCPKA